MSTSKQEFIDLAAELIEVEFLDFADDCVLTKTTGWNNSTQTATTETQTIKAIRLEFNSNQVNNESVKVGDYKIVAEYQLITLSIDVGSTSCSFAGENLSIVKMSIDPAYATITFHVRRK